MSRKTKKNPYEFLLKSDGTEEWLEEISDDNEPIDLETLLNDPESGWGPLDPNAVTDNDYSKYPYGTQR